MNPNETPDFFHPARIQRLNDRNIRNGDWVLYWMQQSQRAHYNHALEYTVHLANSLHLPPLVVFGLDTGYPDANLRHFQFMLEGLRDTEKRLADRGIRLVIRVADPPSAVRALADRASLIVCDCGYLRHQRAWRTAVAAASPCPVIQVESDVVVPVSAASPKADYAARTLRPKIRRQLSDFLDPLKTVPCRRDSLHMALPGESLSAVEHLLETGPVDRSVAPVTDRHRGGTTAALERLEGFLGNRLAHYDRRSSRPEADAVSGIGMYLHFGHISPLYAALQVMKRKGDCPEACESYLEQLIVRRELAANFVHYTPDYDRYGCLPAWSRKTLAAHAGDRREAIYSTDQLENAQTHDPYWNAAMQEMRHTGYLHNTLRMYWGKKILEWRPTPQDAFATTLSLNNRYFLDGRDPNAYAGVAWIYGLHDRAWPERPVFGKVRCMTASGLERKYDMRAYMAAVADRIGKPGELSAKSRRGPNR